MATYREIKGLTVQSLPADPSLSSDTEGQVWFNTSTRSLKSLVKFAAWSSTNSLITPRQGYASSFGPQTAGIAAGGYTYPSPPPDNTAECEEYNGTGWSSIDALINPGYGSQGAGTVAAGICFGMASPAPLRPRTEEYDGTSWAAASAMSTGHGYFSGGGTLTAAIAAGGNVPAASLIAEEWNGTGWTTINSMVGTARTSYLGTGTTSAFWCTGGYTPPTTYHAETEQYDGTSWTAGGAPNTARGFGGGSGPATAALQFGGSSTNPSGDVTYNWAKTESYDGTTWTELSSEMSIARGQGFQLGVTNTAALVAGGVNPYSNPAVEEYSVSINAITAGAWSAGGNLATSGSRSGVGATTNAAIVMGASAPPSYTLSNQTELYDGTAWSTSPATLQTAVSGNSSAGTSTSALSFGGQNPSPTGQTEEWDGTSWATSPGSMTSTAYGRFGFGTQTAAVAASGYPPSSLVQTEEYNGATWSTSPGDMSTSRYDGGSTGILTAGLAFGGNPSPGSAGEATEEYGGTTWTAGGTMLAKHHNIKGFGTQTATTTIGQGITYGVKTYSYDGTAWSTNANNTTARGMLGGTAGTSTAGLGAGGYGPGYFNATEEFTGEVETATSSNITSS